MRFNRVVLVNPYAYYATGNHEATMYPPLGLASIASVLRDNGIACTIIDAGILRLNTRQVIDKIDHFKPDLVGISLSLPVFRAGKELCAALKENLDLNVCFGGVCASSHYPALLRETRADFALRGEGEFSLLELCQGKELGSIAGLAYKKFAQIIVNTGRSLIDDLDVLPHPAHDLLPSFSLYAARTRRKPMAPIITSRGCPCTCGYCNSSIFGEEFRSRSPEHVLSEIDLLVNKFKIRQIDILDDDFTLIMPRAEKILDLIAERNYDLVINLHHGVRADSVTLPLVQKMKRAGVFKVGIRIESGNADVPGKPGSGLDLEKVNIAFDWFRWNGIMTSARFMIGLPHDTAETINQTIQLAIDLDPDIADFSIFVPLPDTRIFNELREAGLLDPALPDDRLTGGFSSETPYSMCGKLSQEKILELRNRAHRLFNLRLGKVAYTVLNIRSFAELKGFADTLLPLLKNLFQRQGGKPAWTARGPRT